jgi:hypothetical protein
MDDRLKQVQTTDLTDSRLNYEFVEWLKTKGLNWLLAILLVVCAYLAWDLWSRREADRRNQAWTDLSSATMPEAFEAVANDHEQIDSVSNLALLNAGDGLRPGMDATEEGSTLDTDGRTEMLDNADRLYAKVIQHNENAQGFASKPITISALFGRAAVAESRGDIEAAKSTLKHVARIAVPEYPGVALQAEARMEDLEQVTSFGELPTSASLAPISTEGNDFTPPVVDDMLEFFETDTTTVEPAATPAATPAAP